MEEELMPSSGRAQKTALKGELDVDFSAISVDGDILSDDKYFTSRLELIPAKFYFPKDDKDKNNDDWKFRKFHKNKTNDAPKQKVKEASKKAKRAKYSAGIERESNMEIMKQKDKVEQEQNEQNDTKSESQKKDKKNGHGGGSEKNIEEKPEPARNLDELSQRLQAKLEALRKKRGGKGLSKHERVEKAVQKKQNAKRAKREKKKALRKQMAADAKAKRKEAIKSLGGETDKDGHKQNGDISDNHDKIHSKLSESITKISYGRLEVNGDDKADTDGDGQNGKRKAKVGKRNILNVRKMLEVAEKNKDRIEQLRKSKNPEDRKKADEEKWDNLEKLAAGEKTENMNPKRLKKHLKRLEREKRKKQEAWKARAEATKSANDETYRKKMSNIKAHAQNKIERKLKKKGIVIESNASTTNGVSVEEGKPREKRKRKWLKMQQEQQQKQRPGFEGKHVGVLNPKRSNVKKSSKKE